MSEINYSAPIRESLPMAYFHQPERDGVMLLKNHGAAALVALDGVDTECLDNHEVLDATVRFEQAVRFLDVGNRLYQYQVKRRTPESLFDIRLVHGIVADPSASRMDSLLALFSTRRAAIRAAAKIDRRVADLRSRARRYAEHLGDFGARLLDAPDAFAFLAGLLNYDNRRALSARLKGSGPLDWQLSMSGIEQTGGIVRVGGLLASVLTLKTEKPEIALPESTFPDFLRRIREAPVESILVTEFKPIAPGAARSKLLAIAKENERHGYIEDSAGSLIGSVGNAIHGGVQQSPPRKDVVAQGSIEQADEARKKLAFDGMMLGDFGLSCIVIGRTRDELIDSVDEIQKQAVATGIALYEQESKAHIEWFAQFPGGERLLAKSVTVTEHVHADMSMIFAPAKGSARNQHLNGPNLLDLKTRRGTRYWMNLNDDGGRGDAHHAIVLGKTGSGKTYKFRRFASAMRDRHNAVVIILDKKDDYLELTRQYGGSYMRAGKGGGFACNPLSLEPTQENLRFIDTLLSLVIERDGFRMTTEERKEAWDEVAAACSMFPKGDHRRRLGQLVLPPRLMPQLEPWIGNGKYGWLFDHVEDTVSFADWQAFSFASFDKEMMQGVGEPLLYYILHRAKDHICDPANADRAKFFGIDEAWLMISNEAVREAVKDLLKTGRDKRCCVLLATQSGSDFEGCGIWPAIKESIATKILLKNPDASREFYSKQLGLNEAMINEVLSGLKQKREFMIVQDGRAVIVELDEQETGNLKVKEMTAWASGN